MAVICNIVSCPFFFLSHGHSIMLHVTRTCFFVVFKDIYKVLHSVTEQVIRCYSKMEIYNVKKSEYLQ